MPLLKRKPFSPLAPPPGLGPEEEVFFLKMTNEIFRDYDAYFDRVILCNSLVWSCSLTGKANLTFQEAVESERGAKKQLKGFPRPLKKALFYLSALTKRGKFSDLVEDVLTYARDRYFKGEEVLSVIGNLWCPSKVIRIVYPTAGEMEAYKQDQIQKGLYEKNDYLRDDSWGPSPDLFRYEVQEIDVDTKRPVSSDTHVLEAIDVKREKTILTRDKCKILLKLATDLVEEKGIVMVKPNVVQSYGLQKMKYEDTFVGKPPQFEESPMVVKMPVSKPPKAKVPSKAKENEERGGNSKEGKSKKEKEPGGSGAKKSSSGSGGGSASSKKPVPTSSSKKPGKAEPKPKKEKIVQLTPAELKQLELEKRAREREALRAQRKLVADFKKLWFKPKEDLEVEDLKDLPTPDPVCCKIPNNLFGDFMMILEFLNCYNSTLKVRDCFPSGISFDILERALTKNEVAGPFSDILQLLIKAIFRLEEFENAEITEEDTQTVDFDDANEMDGSVTAKQAVEQATAFSTWSIMYQSTPLHKLSVDHLSISEILRLHILSSGAKPSEKDVKWRSQQRGGYTETDDPGLQLRLEEPQVIKTLSSGTVFDLTMREKLKLLQCLSTQIGTYVNVRDTIEESFEQYKLAKVSLRSLQAAEKRKDAEDHWWRTKLQTERIVPDLSQYKVDKQTATATDSQQTEGDSQNPSSGDTTTKPGKPPLTDEQMEYQLNKRDKEVARRKQDFLWKEAELQDQILKHERRLGLHPLGRDRAYRRYWVFPTTPGLFVEHDDEFVGDCLPSPTPYLDSVNFDDLTFVKETYNKYLQVDKEGSDKENSVLNSPASKKSSKKKKNEKEGNSSGSVEQRPQVFGLCNGNKDTCPVHCIYHPRPKWSFFWNPDHVDLLIENLSPRGIREKDLRAALAEEKEGLKGYLGKCPALKLNREGKFPEHITNAPEKRPQRGGATTTQKNRLDPNLNYPVGTAIETILELQLRDVILEVEEKIFLGALGSLKIRDRNEWRKALESRGYDPQTQRLTWAEGKTLNVRKRKEGILNGKETGEQGKSDQVSSHSSSNSSSSEQNKDDNSGINPVVKDLACAILQISKSIEAKFLRRPLGEHDKDEKKKKKDLVEPPVNLNLPAATALERWELSLMACTSFSQLFVHLFTFENSVEWSKSVLNLRCRICRRKGDAETMLLCDGCNRGYHSTCLKPAIEVIPKGDWYCYDCRPEEPPPVKARNKKRRLADEEDILDEINRSSDSEEEDVRPAGSRRGMGSRRSHENNLGEEEICTVCSFGGELTTCEECSDSYHLLCVNPPLTRPPRGAWQCPPCKTGSGSSSKNRSTSSIQKRGKVSSSSRRVLESEEEDEEEEEEDGGRSDEEDSRNGVNSDENESTTEDEAEDNSERSSDEEKEVVKVRFGKRSTVNSGRKRVYEEDEDYVDSEEERRNSGARGSRRKCASQAAAKIAQVAKRLRSDSKENESSSDNSNDSSNFLNRKRTGGGTELGEGYEGADAPKRTRLQRMNTNNRVRNGELDNVLLDKVLSEVMKNKDAWPFLKPVTRMEAPDYHDIVKHPMDLGTIKYKLNSMVYTCNEEFISDLLLVFSNCELYNQPNTRIFIAGQSLKQFCEQKFSKIGIQISD